MVEDVHDEVLCWLDDIAEEMKDLMIAEVFMNSGADSRKMDHGNVMNERRVTRYREDPTFFAVLKKVPSSTVQVYNDQELYFEDGTHMDNAALKRFRDIGKSRRMTSRKGGILPPEEEDFSEFRNKTCTH